MTMIVVGGDARPARDRVAVGAEQRGELDRGQRRRGGGGPAGLDARAGRRHAARQRGVIASSAAFQQVAATLAVHDATSPGGTTSSRTAIRARRSTRCAADRAATSPTSSCSSRPGSRCSRSPTASASWRARARSGSSRPRSPTPSGRATNRTTSSRSRVSPGPTPTSSAPTRPRPQILQKIVTQFDAKADEIGLGGVGRRERRAQPVPGVGERVAHRGRGRHQGRRAAHLRGHRQPAQGRHAAADRRHALLRQGRLPAGAHRRRPQDRLAVQHLQGARACRPRRSGP